MDIQVCASVYTRLDRVAFALLPLMPYVAKDPPHVPNVPPVKLRAACRCIPPVRLLSFAFLSPSPSISPFSWIAFYPTLSCTFVRYSARILPIRPYRPFPAPLWRRKLNSFFATLSLSLSLASCTIFYSFSVRASEPLRFFPMWVFWITCARSRGFECILSMNSESRARYT